MLEKVLKVLYAYKLNIIPYRVLVNIIKDFFLNSSSKQKEHIVNLHKSIRFNVNPIYTIEKHVSIGFYDLMTTFIINKFVKKGDVCIDIGANVGAITLMLAKNAGTGGKIFAFEPGEFLYNRLLNNILLNPDLKKTISTFRIGLSNKKQTLYWQLDPTNPGNAFFSASEGIAMNLTTVDIFFEEVGIDKIDFVKIDVEGMELEVIEGGINTWIKYSPIIYYESLFEYEQDQHKLTLKKIEDILTELGYIFFKITNTFKIIPTKYPDLSSNTLALPAKKRLT